MEDKKEICQVSIHTHPDMWISRRRKGDDTIELFERDTLSRDGIRVATIKFLRPVDIDTGRLPILVRDKKEQQQSPTKEPSGWPGLCSFLPCSK